MEKNIKIELMKSVDSIKKKIKQMKEQEHSMNLSLDKMLKPVTDPLKTLVDSNKTIEKIQNLENTHSNFEDMELDSIDTSSSTKFEECYDPKLNSTQALEVSSTKEKPDDLEISLEGRDIHDIYDGTNLNIPFGIRSVNKTLLMGNSLVSFSKIDTLNDDSVILIKIGDKSYNLTPGLKELLLRRKPDLKLISSKDKLVYKVLV